MFHHFSERGRIDSCSKRYQCDVERSRIDMVQTISGEKSVTVIEECSCKPKPHNCMRVPKTITLYEDTPLETTIDVGECRGKCLNGNI